MSEAVDDLEFSDITQRIAWLNGKPFSLEDYGDRPYAYDIYNSSSRNIILKNSRQTEKTTFVSVRIALLCALKKYFKALYVNRDYKKCTEFSRTRLSPLFNESPLLQKYMRGDNVIDQVFLKRLSNKSEIFFAPMYLHSENVRGITADLLCIDEIQSILRDHIDVAESTQSHSPYKLKLYTGTPLTFDNPIESHWRKSTQFEWIITCTHCARANDPLCIPHIGKTGIVCQYCDGELYVQEGKWLAMGDPKARWEGYHINYLLVPWCDWEELLRLYEEASHEGKFYNEVLGLSHSTADQVLTEEQVFGCCDARPMAAHYTRMPPVRTHVIGVDWGGTGRSYTVIVVGGIYNNKFYLNYVRKMDGMEPLREAEFVAKLGKDWGTKFYGVDQGAGHGQNDYLKRLVTGSGAAVVRYQSSANSRAYMKYNPGSGIFTINRTETLTHLFDLIRHRKVSLPKRDHFEPYAADLLGIYEEYNPKSRVIRYDHREDQPDDLAHAMNYCLITAEREAQQRVA